MDFIASYKWSLVKEIIDEDIQRRKNAAMQISQTRVSSDFIHCVFHVKVM